MTFLPSSGLFDTKAGLYARLAAAVPSMYAVVRPSCSCVRVVFDMVYSAYFLLEKFITFDVLKYIVIANYVLFIANKN